MRMCQQCNQPCAPFDGNTPFSSQVLAAGPRDMRMYYHSYDVRAQRFRVGLATSADGFNWTRQGVVFEGDSQNGECALGVQEVIAADAAINRFTHTGACLDVLASHNSGPRKARRAVRLPAIYSSFPFLL